MIRLAPLITADVDTTTLPGGKASDAAQDFLALLSEALAGETTTDKAAPQLLVATDKPTTKGEPLVSDIVSDAQQADLLIPVDETLPVINDEQSTSTPLTTAQTMTLAADAPRDKCTLSCAINGIHAAFHYLKKNYISGCVMTVPTGW